MTERKPAQERQHNRSRLDRLTQDRVRERYKIAVPTVRQACAALAEMGVSVRVIGSLAEGRFALSSDVDLLITECPSHLRYAIEGIVEDCLGGIPFDVVYLDEIRPHRVKRFTRHAMDPKDLPSTME